MRDRSAVGLSALALLMLVVSSCKTTQTVFASPKTTEITGAALIDSSLRHSEFTYLSAKVNVEYNRNGEVKNFNVRARFKMDSMIWVSIAPAMGIEVMRLCLSPDSVKLLNRMDQTYIASTFDEANEKLGLSEDFNLVQALITGMFAKVHDQSTYSSSIVGTDHVLNADPEKSSANDLPKPLTHQATISSVNWRVLKTLLVSTQTNESIDASYATFQNIGSFTFPTQMEVNLKGKGQLNVRLNWSKVELPASLDFPFSIPEKYAPYK